MNHLVLPSFRRQQLLLDLWVLTTKLVNDGTDATAAQLFSIPALQASISP